MLKNECDEYSFPSPQAQTSTEFGDSWVVNPEECDDLPPGPTDPCDEGLGATRGEAEDLCFYLVDKSGKCKFFNKEHFSLGLALIYNFTWLMMLSKIRQYRSKTCSMISDNHILGPSCVWYHE